MIIEVASIKYPDSVLREPMYSFTDPRSRTTWSYATTLKDLMEAAGFDPDVGERYEVLIRPISSSAVLTPPRWVEPDG